MEPSAYIVAITSLSSLLTVALSRIRCLCDQNGNCKSGCLETPLIKDDHEMEVQEYTLGGKQCLIITAKINDASP